MELIQMFDTVEASNIHLYPLSPPPRAFLAIPSHLKGMTDASELLFSAELPLQLLKFLRKKLCYLPASKAYKMVVMPMIAFSLS
ncbi:MAG: hypothetical protein A2Z09_05565 [Nitrospirae bacterium RBG_16_43_8]|nr:MAG: hypothetical protein A2Z09_05565 [Nitrospirae bacterium RBG_16_43_8]